MQKEVTIDLRAAYYRGRYRATMDWSKVGKGHTDEDLSMSEGVQSKQEKMAKQYSKSALQS
jgi:hypothetical protein